MLALPQSGFSVSAKKHNCDPVVVSDWVEGSCLFVWGELSVQEVVDVLLEEQIYSSQDLASTFVRDIWVELSRRAALTGSSCGIQVIGDRVRIRNGNWQDFAGHSFCLILSLAAKYDWWKSHFEPNYNEQGEIFELLTKESLETLTPDWDCYISGWSRNSSSKFEDLVDEVAKKIGDGSTVLNEWEDSGQKDFTLDVLLYKSFLDGLPGVPSIFLQCASGKNWREKIGKPDLALWQDVVRTFTPPTKGFAVPFCFSDIEFKKNCLRAQGLLLDRLRILGAGLKKQSWISQQTRKRINAWLEPFVEGLVEKSECS